MLGLLWERGAPAPHVATDFLQVAQPLADSHTLLSGFVLTRPSHQFSSRGAEDVVKFGIFAD